MLRYSLETESPSARALWQNILQNDGYEGGMFRAMARKVDGTVEVHGDVLVIAAAPEHQIALGYTLEQMLRIDAMRAALCLYSQHLCGVEVRADEPLLNMMITGEVDWAEIAQHARSVVKMS